MSCYSLPGALTFRNIPWTGISGFSDKRKSPELSSFELPENFQETDSQNFSRNTIPKILDEWRVSRIPRWRISRKCPIIRFPAFSEKQFPKVPGKRALEMGIRKIPGKRESWDFPSLKISGNETDSRILVFHGKSNLKIGRETDFRNFPENRIQQFFCFKIKYNLLTY